MSAEVPPVELDRYAAGCRCVGCGYEIGGIAVGRCPECGVEQGSAEACHPGQLDRLVQEQRRHWVSAMWFQVATLVAAVLTLRWEVVVAMALGSCLWIAATGAVLMVATASREGNWLRQAGRRLMIAHSWILALTLGVAVWANMVLTSLGARFLAPMPSSSYLGKEFLAVMAGATVFLAGGVAGAALWRRRVLAASQACRIRLDRGVIYVEWAAAALPLVVGFGVMGVGEWLIGR